MAHFVSGCVYCNSLVIVKATIETYAGENITIQYTFGVKAAKQRTQIRNNIYIALQIFILVVLSGSDPTTFCLPSADTHTGTPCRSKLITDIYGSSRRDKVSKLSFTYCMGSAYLHLHKPMTLKFCSSFLLDLSLLCRSKCSTQ